MMNKKKSLKFKLLLYYLLIQSLLFFIFGATLIKFLQDAIYDKMETNLKVIILDIKDDIIEHNIDFQNISLQEEVDEFELKPLAIKITRDEKTFTTKAFPKSIPIKESLERDKIFFELTNDTAVATLRFELEQSQYAIQILSVPQKIEELFPNLRYIIIFIAPIILFFAVFFGNILISRAFRPIELLLKEIQSISAKSLSKRVQTRGTNDEIDQISQEVNKLLERVDRAYSQISQFTTDVSHELKTPLTIMRGELEVSLNKSRSSDEYKRVVKSSLDEVLSIQQIIENLLLLARMDTSSLDNKNELIYLDEMLLDIIKELQPLSKRKNSTLRTYIKEPISLYGNEHLLKVALKNILQNSIFYSYEDSKVFIHLKKEHNIMILSIEDFGIGMSQKTIEHIFEKFYRGDESRSKHTGGSGLGMSIVKKILSLHKIEIQIDSKLQRGTKVTLTKDLSK